MNVTTSPEDSLVGVPPPIAQAALPKQYVIVTGGPFVAVVVPNGTPLLNTNFSVATLYPAGHVRTMFEMVAVVPSTNFTA